MFVCETEIIDLITANILKILLMNIINYKNYKNHWTTEY